VQPVIDFGVSSEGQAIPETGCQHIQKTKKLECCKQKI
jgi:hypothetical protein